MILYLDSLYKGSLSFSVGILKFNRFKKIYLFEWILELFYLVSCLGFVGVTTNQVGTLASDLRT